MISQNTTLIHDIYKAQCKFSYSQTRNQSLALTNWKMKKNPEQVKIWDMEFLS